MQTMKREIPEAMTARMLTLERTHCIQCWAQGLRVHVVRAAEAERRPGETYRAALNRYRKLRRRLTAAHYNEAHPDYKF